MKAFVISLAGAALLAGCGGSDQQQVENGIRAQLASQGTVSSVSMTKQSDGNFTGTAVVRAADGHDARLNCTARRDASTFSFMCGQVIDDQLIAQIETLLRANLTQQGVTVTELEMTKQNEDLISGHAVVRDGSGAEARLTCTSPRDPATGRFGGGCRADTAAAGAAPAAEGAAPAEEGAAPAEADQN